MSVLKKTALVASGAMLVASGAGSVATVASAATMDEADTVVEVAAVDGGKSMRVQQTKTEGSFSFMQDVIDSNEYIKRHLAAASAHLCGANPEMASEGVSAEDWFVSVRGAVAREMSMSFGELSQSPEAQKVLMGCTCAANHTDGNATANAEVEGVSIIALLKMAGGVDPEANTIVFASADGYEVELPLNYVIQRYCPLVFAVNDAELCESVGGVNQLWLGATPASYFVRDVTSITVEVRDDPPPSPVSDEARAKHANLPNIGITFGGEAA